AALPIAAVRDRVPIAGTRERNRIHLAETGQRIRPDGMHLRAPGLHALRLPGIETVAAQAPEEAELRGVVTGARTDRQEADHPARGHVPLPQLVDPRPVATRDQAPQRTPGIRSVEAAIRNVPAQPR